MLIILVVFTIQSCNTFSKVKETEYECANDLTYWGGYEDTIQIKFVGVDSSIFKGKNYKVIADSLFWEGMGMGKYGRRDVMSKDTGRIHRIIFENEDYDYQVLPYDTLLYFRVN